MQKKTTIQVLILQNQLNLITEIEEVLVDFGEPNCKLTNPCLINDDGSISLWLKSLTNDTEIMMSSDKILTLVEPNGKLLDEYLEITK
jgi:hypothetical protein